MKIRDVALDLARFSLSALLLHAAAAPEPALAAFELRDASPEALGTASTDGARIPFLDEPEFSGGWGLGGSRASIFGAEGLDWSQLDAVVHAGPHAVRLAWTDLSAPGARES